jgi:hypothetical protein
LAELRFLHMIAEDLETRGTAMMDLVESKPGWVQTVWVFVCMGCVSVVGFQVWEMQFGDVLLATLGLIIGLIVSSKWRFGPMLFVGLAGGAWAVTGTNRAAAIVVTVALLILVALMSFPHDARTRAVPPHTGQKTNRD